MEDNIKKAISREELSRPTMPKDLNARLMQRVEKEVNHKPKPKRKHIIWPWVAAACVAAMIAVYLTPPKTDIIGGSKTEVAKVEKDTTKQQTEPTVNTTPPSLLANTEREPQVKKEVKASDSKVKEPLMSRTECAEQKEAECKVAPEVPTQGQKDVAVADNPATPSANSTVKPRVLSERDIPITRPENLKYTKEELALMRKQANEAYIKWIELELEIARYNQEQTALK